MRENMRVCIEVGEKWISYLMERVEQRCLQSFPNCIRKAFAALQQKMVETQANVRMADLQVNAKQVRS